MIQAQQISTLRKQLDSERAAREAIEVTSKQMMCEIEKTRAAADRPESVANMSCAEHQGDQQLEQRRRAPEARTAAVHDGRAKQKEGHA